MVELDEKSSETKKIENPLATMTLASLVKQLVLFFFMRAWRDNHALQEPSIARKTTSDERMRLYLFNWKPTQKYQLRIGRAFFGNSNQQWPSEEASVLTIGPIIAETCGCLIEKKRSFSLSMPFRSWGSEEKSEGKIFERIPGGGAFLHDG